MALERKLMVLWTIKFESTMIILKRSYEGDYISA